MEKSTFKGSLFDKSIKLSNKNLFISLLSNAKNELKRAMSLEKIPLDGNFRENSFRDNPSLLIPSYFTPSKPN